MAQYGPPKVFSIKAKKTKINIFRALQLNERLGTIQEYLFKKNSSISVGIAF